MTVKMAAERSGSDVERHAQYVIGGNEVNWLEDNNGYWKSRSIMDVSVWWKNIGMSVSVCQQDTDT